MERFTISFTEPNNEWLKEQVESKEYSSKSELINELIRKERQREDENKWLKEKLTHSRNSGITSSDRDMILREAQTRYNDKEL